MELKAGYKQTEVGVIPEDWNSKTLGEICEKIQDGNYGGDYPKSYEFINFGVPFLTSKVIGKDGELREHLIDYISEQKHSELKKAHIVLDDVLFTNRGASVGAIGLVDIRIAGGNIGPQLTLLRSLKDSVIPTYLFQVMKSFVVQKQIKSQDSGSAMNFFGVTATKKFIIPLPSAITEQTAIANALSDADALIQSLTRLIAKKRQIKQGAMQTLLNPYENGQLKAGWVVKLLEDVAYYRRGSFPQPYGLPEWFDEINGTPFVQVYDVDSNMRLKSSTKQKISDLAKDKSVFVKEGTVILTIQGSIGRIAVTQYDSYIDRTLLIFTGYQIPMDDMFFAFIVQEKFRIEKENAPGGIIKTITKEALSKFDLHFPNKQEQTRIATILSDMDTEIATLETKLAKYQQIKQGMMQNLLTGRIRLVKPENNTGAVA